jgi:signal transduction histidine kinase
VKSTVYESIVSKMGTILPLFGKAMVDMALKRRRHTPETISPVEMLDLIKNDINPRLAHQLHTVSTVLHAGAGMVQLDEHDRVVYANSMVRRMTAASERESPSDLFAILCAHRFVRPVREVSTLEIHDFHSDELGKDFSVILCPIHDGTGRVRGEVSIIQDVTIREAIDAEIVRFHEHLRRLNESLIKAEANLRDVVQCITDPILVVDGTGRVQHANPAAQRLCAAPSEEALIGRNVEELVRPTTPFAGGLMSALKTERELRDVDAELLPAGQHAIPVLLSGALLRGDPAGGAVFSAKDMRHQHALMAKLVSSSKLAALGEMAAGIAHEVNTPLSVIQGRAGQIRHMVTDGEINTPALAGFAEKIEATTRRIARIVRGLRAFARQGDQDPIQPTPMTSIVGEVLDLCRERFAAHGVALRTGAIDESLRVPCRATQIEQVLLNLLSNAFDAADHSPEKWVELSVAPHDNEVQIAVEDSGPGVPEELRERMFQPFFTTKPVGKGTGLGLSISQSIAQQHGGSLALDENSPHTRFVLSLPLSSPQPA